MPETAAAPSLIVIGGVPGAGKSTAIATALTRLDDRPDLPPLRALDSDQVRRWMSAQLPPGLAYRWYRPLVHTLHVVRVLAWLALGPRRAGVRLIVHDPCTRTRRLHRLAELAGHRGWTSALLLVDVGRAEARAGQLSRGRVIDPENFERHWQRWQQIRADHQALPGWSSVTLTSRSEAAEVLEQLAFGGRPATLPSTLPMESIRQAA